MFEDEKESLSDFSEDAIEVFLKVLTGQMTWDEFYEDEDEVTGERYAPPEWLLELTGRLDVDFLYSVEYEQDPGSFSLGWIHDEASGDYWMFSTSTEVECWEGRLSIAGKDPTPDEVWKTVLSDLQSTGDSCLYGDVLWCNADLVPRDRIVPHLKEMLTGAGLKRLGAGTGPTVEEWADSLYGKDPAP